MPILADQAIRLLRDDWVGDDGATRLSQELYAIFTGKEPLTISGPVQIDNPGNVPAITITQDPVTNPQIPPILVQPPAGSSGTFGTDPIVVTDKSPGSDRNDTGRNPPPSDGSNPTKPVRVTQTTYTCTERTDFMGTISGGSGATYTIALEDNIQGPAAAAAGDYTINASATVTATCRTIDADAEITTGTFVNPVTRTRTLTVVRRTYTDANGKVTGIAEDKTVAHEQFTFQVPVWI